MTTNEKRLHALNINEEGHIATQHIVSRSLDGYLGYVNNNAYVKDEPDNDFWLHIRRSSFGTIEVLNPRNDMARHFGKGFYHDKGYPIAWIIT